LPAGAQVKSVISDFPIGVSQEKTNWCWAAVLSGTRALYPAPGLAMSQSAVANAVQRQPQASGNEMADLGIGLRCLHYKGVKKLAPYDLNGIKSFPNSISAMLDGKRPVPIHIDWGNGGEGHAICAIGYGSLNGAPALVIYDPAAVDNLRDNLTMVTLSGMSRYEAALSDKTLYGKWVAAYVYD
jgi:hypothetical protein